MKYVENYGSIDSELGFNDSMSITDKRYKHYSKAYSYALDMTKREIHQAVEGMYHNLRVFG